MKQVPASNNHTPHSSVAVKPARIDSLDGLRAIAVLLVIAYHASPDTVKAGLVGVDVFFVLSGYLITEGIARRILTDRAWLSGFWLRRGRRLLPALLTTLIGGTALALVTYPTLPARLGTQVFGALTWTLNWLFISQNNSYFTQFEPPWWQHLWSLAVEMQYYVLWPLLLMLFWGALKRFNKGRRLRILATITWTLTIASAAAFVIGAVAGVDMSRLYMGTDTHAFGMLAGSALALSHLSFPRHDGVARRSWSANQISIAVLLGMILTVGVFIQSQEATGLVLALLSTTALTTTLVHAAVRMPQNFLAAKPLQWIGTRSYAIYLWHWPLLLAFRSLIPVQVPWRDAVLFIISGGVSVILAAVSWRWIEEPILTQGWRKTLRTWREVLLARPMALCATLTLVLFLIGIAVIAIVLSPGQGYLETQLTQ